MQSSATRVGWSRLYAFAVIAFVAMLGWAAIGRSDSDIRSADRNRDGRPDIWRAYDHRGRVAEIAIDTNFDGRSDVREIYESGTLVRRESDRDFNDRVDLVQEFDPASAEIVRTVSDINFDGTADRLDLYSSGRRVYSKTASAAQARRSSSASERAPATSGRSGNEPLSSMDDPFSGDLAIAAVRVAADYADGISIAPSVSIPDVRTDLRGCPDATPASIASSILLSFAPAGSISPRGPPRA